MQYMTKNQFNSQLRFSNFKSILSIYFYTIGSLFLGFSLYLFTTLNNDNNFVTSWTGQTLFWALIIFFLSLFILFLPIEFFNSTNLKNSSFNELVSNVIIVIGISLFFLATSQFFINADSLVINELKIIIRSVSFSGFIAIPLFLFILQSIGSKVNFFSKNVYGLLFFIWIISSQLFL